MTHFGIICPTSAGHLNPMTALGRELQQRGHRVTQVQILDAKKQALAAGFDFQVIGESEFPLGSVTERFARLGQLTGLAAVRYTVSIIQQAALMVLRDAPKAIKDAGIEAYW
jgi:UDP:flavonoid glycosyltransferase YjiC (YdhE family)